MYHELPSIAALRTPRHHVFDDRQAEEGACIRAEQMMLLPLQVEVVALCHEEEEAEEAALAAEGATMTTTR